MAEIFLIFSLVPFIATSINESSVLLLTEICTFMTHYLLNNRELLDRVAAQEVSLQHSLVTLMDVGLYRMFSIALNLLSNQSTILCYFLFFNHYRRHFNGNENYLLVTDYDTHTTLSTFILRISYVLQFV